MRIVVAADHGGFALKNDLATHLRSLGHEVIDVGTDGAASVDYPDFAALGVAEVLAGRAEKALLVCGSGVGMSIAANRHRGIRAVVCSDVYTARMSREHNNANALCLGARVVGPGLAQQILDVWLETPYAGTASRHQQRLDKLEKIAP
jgi:ribose 5-phosphate isomerase B